MSLSHLLEIGRRSLLTANAQMGVTGQNIANAETEGYSRRRITQETMAVNSPGVFIRTLGGSFMGTGVSVQSIERVRDAFLAESIRETQSGLAGAEQESRSLSALEGLLATGTEGSLTSVAGRFWGAWQALANDPTNISSRNAVLRQTSALTTALHRVDADVAQVRNETLTMLRDGVDDVNKLLDQTAALNQTITTSKQSGTPNLVAMDKRDRLVKELASYAAISVDESPVEGFSISIQGMKVVQGVHAAHLKVDDSASPPDILFGDTDVAYAPGSDYAQGKLGALSRILETTIPNLQNSLDTFASTLIEEVNELHEAGYDLDDETDAAFFKGADAGTIALADGIQDPSDIAAAAESGRPGDASVAQEIFSLRSTQQSDLQNVSFSDFVIDMVADVGGDLEQAGARVSAHAAMAEHVLAMQKGMSGVSLDEEMVDLIKYQQAFAASARIVQTTNEMFDTIFAM